MSPWLFAAKRLDSSGLYFFGKRFYDPEVGRWITPDPARFVDGQNLYAFVHSRPLVYFDENGLYSFGQCISCAIDILLLAGGAMLTPAEPMVYSTNDLIDPNTGKNYNFPDNPNANQVYANGLLNRQATFNDSLIQSSINTGFNTVGVFTPTQGVFVDSLVYLAEHFGYRSPGSLAVQKTLEERCDPSKPIEIIAHSRACLSTRNALMATTDSVRNRTYYLAVCPGGYTEREYCQEVRHLCSENDLVPYLDFIGRQRCKDTIIEIKRHEDASWFDHSFTSPTFRQPIIDTVKEYEKLILKKLSL